MFCNVVIDAPARAANSSRERPTASRRARMSSPTFPMLVVVVVDTDNEASKFDEGDREDVPSLTANARSGGQKNGRGAPRGPRATNVRRAAFVRIARDSGFPDETIHTVIARTDNSSDVRKTLNRWEKPAHPGGERRDWRLRHTAFYAAAALNDRWLSVSPAPGWSDLDKQDSETIAGAANQLELQACAVRAAHAANLWHIPRPVDPDGYCQLVEGKIAAIRGELAQRQHEADRQRVVANWIADELERSRSDLVQSLAKRPGERGAELHDAALTLSSADEQQIASWLEQNRAHVPELLELGKPAPDDAWGRWRVPLGALDDYASGDASDDYANPTLEAVLRDCGDWPGHPGFCDVYAPALPIRAARPRIVYPPLAHLSARVEPGTWPPMQGRFLDRLRAELDERWPHSRPSEPMPLADAA